MGRDLCGNTFVLLLLLLMGLSRASGCPQGPGCTPCMPISNRNVEITCNTRIPTSQFLITYEINKAVKIKCKNFSNWTDFHLGETSKIDNIKLMNFESCDLPKDGKFATIMKQFVVGDIEKLIFTFHNNAIMNLTRDSFKDLTTIKHLNIADNNLTNVDYDLLHDLRNLTVLNIRNNHLRNLPKDFLNVPNLNIIELSDNKLEIIEPHIFEKLENLTILSMRRNEISDIKPHSFDKLTSINTIELQRNNLTSLPLDIFSKLTKLRQINLSQNKFSNISFSESIFYNNIDLREIKIDENDFHMITLPQKFFGDLPKLEVLHLRHCHFTQLPEDLLWGSTKLVELVMDLNVLTTLPLQFFKDCVNMKKLSLYWNDIISLPDGIFSNMTNLEELNLSKNQLTSISNNLLKGLSSLKKLNMARNKIVSINMDAMHGTRLQVVDFSYNRLILEPTPYEMEFGPISPFQYIQSTIEELNLANNNIAEIFGDWILAGNLRILNLSYNKIKVIHQNVFSFLSEEIRLKLDHNKIQTIEVPSILSIDQNSKYKIFIDLQNNPISYSCNLYYFLEYVKKRNSVENNLQLKMDELPYDYAPHKSISLKDLMSKPFSCSAGLCPESCDCLVFPATKTLLINCSNKRLTEAPKTLPIHPEYSKLEVELNLTANNISTMPYMSQNGYEKVTVLSIANNYISNITVKNLSKKLKVLDLQDNRLTRLSTEVLDFLTNTSLKSLKLANNKWICDCEAHDFFNFMQEGRTRFPDLQNVKCEFPSISIFEITSDELCPMMIEWILGSCISIALLGIFVGLSVAMFYRYQREIKVWLFAHQFCLYFVTEDELDKDKLFDAFISYSHKDEDFVVNNLVPKLETGPNAIKLCVHYRDWLAGEWIPTQIVRSVEDSRRTIVVLSSNFLESVWGRLEFRAAHQQALSEGRARIIVILYGDIGPTESLDPELKSYLTMNTYIQWGDPWFWKKLRYALPHRSSLSNNNVKSQSVFSMNKPAVKSTTDKNELIDLSKCSGPQSSELLTPPYNILDTTISANEIDNTFQKELNQTFRSLPSTILSLDDNNEKKLTEMLIAPQWTSA